MKKEYFTWIGLLPIAIFSLILTEENEMHIYTSNVLIWLLILLSIFLLLYFMTFYLHARKSIVVTMGLILWIIAIIIKCKFL